jgi:branched-chain amino acid transport system permease protein
MRTDPRLADLGWLVAVIVLAVTVPLVAPSNYYMGLVVLACDYGMLGLALNFVFGFIGYTSCGHAAFFGLGAYVAVLLNVYLGVNYWIAVLIATIPGMALGVLVGFASLRIGGAYFAIATLTVAEILRLVADNWVDLTRGPMGMMVPRPSIGWMQSLGLSFQQYYLLIVILALGLLYVAARRILRGPVGRAWIAIRESLDLAESVGVDTVRFRVLNLAISGGIAALAGGLIVPKIFVVSPDLFSPLYSATALLIVVLGGRGLLVGALVGAAIFAWLPELLRGLGEVRLVLFGLVLLLVIRLMPNGLASLFLSRRGLGGSYATFSSPMQKPLPVLDAGRSHETVLSVSGITKHYRGLVAVDNVSFELKRGEILGLMGPNGAGKSTCLGLVSGFIPADSGSVRFLDQDVTGLAPNRLSRMGLVRTFQQTTIFRELSALENVLIATHSRVPATLGSSLVQGPTFMRHEKECTAIAYSLLDRVGLADSAKARAKSMSYGQQRYLSIAVALAAAPNALLLDEPAAGLNPVEAEELATLLRRLRNDGLSILLVEHNVSMMMRLCDRIVVLHHGELLAAGTPEEVRADRKVNEAYFGATS